MEDFGSFWTFQENVDELKQKLQCAKYELEITRNKTEEKMRKNNEHIKKLLQLLQAACKERDDAQTQLKKLQQILAFNKPLKSSDQLIAPLASFPAAPFSPDSPLLSNFAVKPSSIVTESNNLSLDTINNSNTTTTTTTNNNNFAQTQSPLLVDSLSYTTQSTSSPDSGNIGLQVNNLVTAKIIESNTGLCSASTTTSTMTPINMPSTAIDVGVDQATLIIESLAKGRPRPKQGQLLKAVIEAGPLLQTLMVAGSLPRWRNPPGLLTRQIPAVNLKGCESVGLVSNNEFGNTSIYGQINGESIGISPNSMLDFRGTSSNSCLVGGRMMSSALSFGCQASKRQRIL